MVRRGEADLRECDSRRENDWAVLDQTSCTNSCCYLLRASVVSSHPYPSPVREFAVHQPYPPSSRVTTISFTRAYQITCPCVFLINSSSGLRSFNALMIYGGLKKITRQLSLVFNITRHMTDNRAFNASVRGLQVMGTGANELAPSLYLFTDTQRYLFNCCENTTKFCTEHKLRLPKVKNVFVTQLCWEKVGGYCGFLMTQRDTGVNGTVLHGPPSTEEFVATCKRMLGGERIICSASTESIYKDENITIQCIELTPESVLDKLPSDDDTSSPLAKKLRILKQNNSVMSYLCKFADVPGKFNPLQAKQLGLKPGPLYAQLKNGKIVVAPNGKEVHPEEVLGPTIEGPRFLILDCPSVNYFQSLTSNPVLTSCDNISLIVHITPWEVLNTEAYCKFASRFGQNCHHLLLHRSVCKPEISFRDAFKIQYPLNILDPDTYHLPSVGRAPSLVLDTPFDAAMLGRSLLKFDFSSKGMGWRNDSVLPELSLEEIQRPLQGLVTANNKNVIEYIKEVRDNMTKEIQPIEKTEVTAESATCKDPKISDGGNIKITFLGTGSAISTKYRNVSGILLQMPTGEGLLLDCGEGGVSQIYRSFGQQKAEEILMNLKCAFISHMHTDHHTGLCRVLTLREKLLMKHYNEAEQLTIIGPEKLQTWLARYSSCEKLHFSFVDSAFLTEGEVTDKLYPAMAVLGLTHCCTVSVVHMLQAYGICLTHQSGQKIVYSGDARPSLELAEVGKDATVLIHEATFENNLKSDAVIKKHSTTEEALEIGEKMNAKFVILTHFSQRYPKIPIDKVELTRHGHNTTVAFDCMSVRLGDLDKLPRQLPFIRDIFTAIDVVS